MDPNNRLTGQSIYSLVDVQTEMGMLYGLHPDFIKPCVDNRHFRHSVIGLGSYMTTDGVWRFLSEPAVYFADNAEVYDDPRGNCLQLMLTKASRNYLIHAPRDYIVYDPSDLTCVNIAPEVPQHNLAQYLYPGQQPDHIVPLDVDRYCAIQSRARHRSKRILLDFLGSSDMCKEEKLIKQITNMDTRVHLGLQYN